MSPSGRILVVEDQTALLMDLAGALEERGHLVYSANDEDSAIATAAANKPDLCLVDLRLGDGDGVALISKLQEANRDSIFVIMSAYTDAATTIRAMQSGVHDYLTKPFGTDDLDVLLNRSFQRLRLLREKSRAEAELKRSNQELRRMNTRLRLMVDTVKGLRAGESPQEYNRTVLTEFARAMRANGGSLYVCEDGHLVRLHSLDSDHTPPRVPLPPERGSVLARVFETRRPVFVEEIGSEMVLSGSGWTGYRDGSLMSFPLHTADGPVEGVVSLHNPADPPFTTQDLDLGIIFSSLVLETLHTTQAAERLRESEERFRALIENSTDLVVLLDDRGCVVYGSPSSSTLLGYEPGEVLGMNVLDLVHPEDRDQAARRFAPRPQAANGIVVLEIRVRHRDGSWRHFEIGAKDRLDEPTVRGIVVNGRDVTERVRVETALHASEQRYRLLMERAGDAILISERSIVVDCNDKALELLRCPRADVIGHPPFWLAPQADPDSGDSARLSKRIRDSVNAGHDTRFEWLHSRPDGTSFFGDVTTTPIPLKDRTIVMGIVRDITEQKEYQRRIEESEARYRDFFEHSPALNVLVSPELQILDINQAAAEALSCEKEDIIGTRVQEWLPSQEHPELERVVPVIMSGEQRPPREWPVLSRNGSVRTWYARTGAVRKVTQGTTEIGVLLQLTDVTDLRAAEVREREQREQLYQASKLAALGTLLSGVAHEINNPNSFIRMSVDNLRDFWTDALTVLDRIEREGRPITLGGLPYSRVRETVPKMMDSINNGSERIERLVNDLKNFARQSDSVDYEVADLNELLGSAITIIRSTINEATAHFEVVTSGGAVPIRCNRNQIEQIIMNLITNSCQALTSRDEMVRVRVRRGADAPWVELVVEDGGRGIPEDLLPQITDPFFTTRRGEGGTGLGLAVSHRIASDHGGILEFSSVEGQGTTAVLRLPLHDSRGQR